MPPPLYHSIQRRFAFRALFTVDAISRLDYAARTTQMTLNTSALTPGWADITARE
jgi:hypothetical protein